VYLSRELVCANSFFMERSNNIKGLGIILKEKRMDKKLTLDTLSKLTHISVSTLSKLENGKLKRPSSVFLFRLSKVLDIDYNELIIYRYASYFRKKELMKKMNILEVEICR